jgi:uncharacterized protein with ParB-like and HNH nuclease domain
LTATVRLYFRKIPQSALEVFLDYRNRKISIENCNIYDFIRRLAAGKFLIPTFQRLFVWDPGDIVNLWDSIFQSYPIGSVLYWKTPVRLHVHRKIGGFFTPEEAIDELKHKFYILDGQQRATSLLVSFYGGPGKVRELHSFDFTLYFDLTKAAFFFEKDYYKHKWEVDSSFLVKLKDAPELSDDFIEQLSKTPGFSPAIERNLAQLQYLFSDYRIPLIRLEGYDIAGVCAIYERINQTGMRLKNMDILIARGFKNFETVVEEDFPIT